MEAKQIISEYNSLNGQTVDRSTLQLLCAKVKRAMKKKSALHSEFAGITERIKKVVDTTNKSDRLEISLTPIRVAKRPKSIRANKKSKPRSKRKESGKASADVLKKKSALFGIEDVYGLEKDPEGEKGELSGLGFTKDGQQKIYDMITEMVLKLMKQEKKLPWQKPWSIDSIIATNFKSKKPYQGANLFLLNLIAPMLFGKVGPYWMTFKQVKEMGGNVKKGAEAFPIIFYRVYYSVLRPTKKTITEDQYNAMTQAEKTASGATSLFTINYYNVFAQEDIEGIEFPKHGNKRDGATPIESAQAIIDGMPSRPEIINHEIGRAYYSPSEDHIKIPKLEFFKKDQEYYSTLFHELVHATGHGSRLDRFTVNKSDAEGKDDYAFEELIAEMGASYLNAEAGTLYFTLNNSATYLKGWQTKLEDIMKGDNKFFLRASAKAAHAADFILDRVAKEVEQESSTVGSVQVVKQESVEVVKTNLRSLSGIVDAKSIGQLNFKKIELDGRYKNDFLKMFADTLILIWGMPGHGKTVYLLLFAQYLAEKVGLNVLYIANEEMGRSTLTEKINEFNIGHENLGITKKLPGSISDWDAIFFDSVQSMGMNLDKFKKFIEDNPGKMVVAVAQSTKDGDFRGGKDWEHEVDIAGEVINRKLVLRKNRLDPDFAEKSEKLMIDESVKKKKSDHIIKQKVNETFNKKKTEESKSIEV